MKFFTPVLHRDFDQVARLGGIVEIIAERVDDRVRHDDLGREMGDRVDLVLADHLARRSALSPKSATTSSTPSGTAQAKPVERLSTTTTFLARVQKPEHHMAADIAGPARDQAPPSFACPSSPRGPHHANSNEYVMRKPTTWIPACAG